MKIISLLLILFSTCSFSEEVLRLQKLNYIVQSDEVDSTIRSGYFKLSGHTKMFSSINPIQNVLSGCTSSNIWTRTDSLGQFELLLKTTDSVVYFYLDGWSEVVVDDYLFEEGHHYIVDVFMNQIVDVDFQNLKRKPVIYLYSEKDLEVELKLDPYGDMTFTYPEYCDSWNVSIRTNKLFVSEKEYPYFFWEAKSSGLNFNFETDKMEGQIVESGQLTSFFEEKLTQIGLNQTEMTDFITYWVPALIDNEFSLIQFIIDEEYESTICGLEISPKPISSKRIFILASSVESTSIGIPLVSQTFEPFERKGFTLLEWGGAVLDFNRLGH